ncbi:MAG: GIY-YIG nuclease family protein [Myxococcaceae bacterium]|nr:MAG: GIY-YIG nuclease family protein [Myxococcaceae bacterium]
MCDGKALGADVEHWSSFTDAARQQGGPFSRIPTRSGIYVLRVTKTGTTDLALVKERFASSPFMKARIQMDKSSGAMFEALRLGDDRAWSVANFYQARLARIDRIPLRKGALTCPIIYIGRANSLQRRLNELAFEGHTANAPFWALLMSGWEFEVGIKTLRKKAEVAEEARLKQLYRDAHGSALPPLVHR